MCEGEREREWVERGGITLEGVPSKISSAWLGLVRLDFNADITGGLAIGMLGMKALTEPVVAGSGMMAKRR